MNKNNTLEQLENAKRAHMKWVNRANSMIDGGFRVRDPHPLASTACKFGLWFNSEGVNLFNTLQIEGIETIHSIHDQLHKKYFAIYEIYFGSAVGIVYDSKVTLEKRTISKETKEIAKQYFVELKSLSYTMVEELEKLEKHIHSLS